MKLDSRKLSALPLAACLAFGHFLPAQESKEAAKSRLPDKTENAAPKSSANRRPPLAPLDDAAKLAIDRKIMEDAKQNNQIMANLGYLSDVIGARLTGSESLKRANEWTAEKFVGYGLESVKLELWTIPAAWERGTATARIVEPENGQTLTVAAYGWTPGTKGKITGDVVIFTPTSEADLKKYEGKLKDAIILRGPPSTVRPISDSATGYEPRMPGDGPGRRGGPQGKAQPTAPERTESKADPDARKDADKTKPEPKSDAKSDRRSRGEGIRPERSFARMMQFRPIANEFLRKEGAAVTLTDSGKPHGMLNMTGSWRGMDRASAADPMPALFITHDHYSLLHRLASRPEPARTRVEVEITNKIIPGPVAVYNTVGEIKGSERPDEFVVVGAHLDSWDLASGTTDNGTGSSVVLEAARLIAGCGSKPRRTIRFVLFTGEEQGLHGSRAYVQQHRDEMDRTSMCIVHDTGTGRVLTVGLQGRRAIQPIFDKEMVSLKELGVKEIHLGSMGGTDHLSFEQVGVPGFAFHQDPAEYRFTHHSQTDTFDKAREADLIQGAQVMAIMAMRVANLPELLPRDRG